MTGPPLSIPDVAKTMHGEVSITMLSEFSSFDGTEPFAGEWVLTIVFQQGFAEGFGEVVRVGGMNRCCFLYHSIKPNRHRLDRPGAEEFVDGDHHFLAAAHRKHRTIILPPIKVRETMSCSSWLASWREGW